LYIPPVTDKPLIWLASSRTDVRAFPPNVRRVVGFQLRRVQRGLEPNDWKPMPGVGPGVQEIRVHTEGEHRVLYIAKFAEGIYVLHAFEKRTQKTPRRELELTRNRLRALVLARRAEQAAGR
jgi:phage-related protein